MCAGFAASARQVLTRRLKNQRKLRWLPAFAEIPFSTDELTAETVAGQWCRKSLAKAHKESDYNRQRVPLGNAAACWSLREAATPPATPLRICPTRWTFAFNSHSTSRAMILGTKLEDRRPAVATGAHRST